MMTYKKRIIFLLSMITVLVIIYALSIIFSYDMGNTRSASYIWLDSRTARNITAISFNTGWEEFELNKRNNQWFISHNAYEYPARQLRIDDFLNILTTRAAWPVRSSNVTAHERFGLDETASRIRIFQDSAVLLDLLIGNEDEVKREVFLRKAGQNEVRSGDNSIVAFLTNPVVSWYNLRLIPESEGGNIDNVQRLSVFTGDDIQIFTRRNRRWEVTGLEITNQDNNSIDNYIRTILNTEGTDFIDHYSSGDPVFNHSRLVLEFGNGRTITIRLTESDEEGYRLANIEGREYIYTIPPWSANRLFRDADSFEM
jgi:hypothetical protein